MTDSQRNKAKRFRALHEGPGAFIMGNVWDAGSARLIAGLGFEAKDEGTFGYVDRLIAGAELGALMGD